MKLTNKTFGLLACTAAAFFIAACARDPQPSTPEPPVDPTVAGERLMRSMSDTLAKAKSFSFETREQIEVIAVSGEKKAVQLTRKVTVRRPNALFFQLLSQDEKPI